jgi:hypothetical protein
MIRAFPLSCALLLIVAAAICADTTIVDIQKNYSIYLPDNWVRDVPNDSQQFFVDTTYTYPALLSLRRYVIDTSVYGSGNQWTMSHFTAYKLSVQYSVDPVGVVLYSNADSTVKQGALNAAEAYSVFFSYDTSIGAWAEYIRFTACGNGYELYAISDTGDMSAHIGYYAAILQSIRFLSAAASAAPPSQAFRTVVRRLQNTLSSYWYDPLGREFRAPNVSRYVSPGVYLRKKGPQTLYIR